MSDSNEPQTAAPAASVTQSYQARSLAEQEAEYDAWAARYEQDLCKMGYRLPAMAAAAFTAYVPRDAGPILDAGCGGGIQAEALALLGYGPIDGVDFSEGMLAMARTKGIYRSLRRMTMGERLDFADDAFAATLSIGAITPQHAPPSSFDELIRVTRRGGMVVFSLRDDPQQDPAYPASVAAHEAVGAWRSVFATPPGVSAMPYGAQEITHRVHVFEVLR